MTFYTSVTAKRKYLLRTTICKLSDTLHLLNSNPDNRDGCTKSLNGSNNSVVLRIQKPVNRKDVELSNQTDP